MAAIVVLVILVTVCWGRYESDDNLLPGLSWLHHREYYWALCAAVDVCFWVPREVCLVLTTIAGEDSTSVWYSIVAVSRSFWFVRMKEP